jgi:hypothetical protein
LYLLGSISLTVTSLTTYAHSAFVNSGAFSPDGQRAVTASYDASAVVFLIVTFDDIARLLASK